VYARASRWTPTHVNVTWKDDTDHPHMAWVPKDSVGRVTDSEWTSRNTDDALSIFATSGGASASPVSCLNRVRWLALPPKCGAGHLPPP
jgi:hypothetical protein